MTKCINQFYCKILTFAAILAVTSNNGIGGEFSIISPSEFADKEAPDRSINGGSGRIQIVHDASDFSSLTGPHWITQFAYRPDGSLSQPKTVAGGGIVFRMSTTEKNSRNMSSRFAQNVGANEMVVFECSPCSIPIQVSGPEGGPKEFGIVFELDNPFLYDPTLGNLLVDFDLTNGAVLPADHVTAPTRSSKWIVGPLGGSSSFGFEWGGIITEFTFSSPDQLQPGDADQDFDFDQLDLVQVQVGAKYLTGQMATWGEGDWNGAPGGEPGNPPLGDGLFNQMDIIAANLAGVYLQGPYAAIKLGGVEGDNQTSLVYNSNTGKLALDAPSGKELTSINVASATGKFIGAKPAVLDGAFDNFAADNVFKATFGGSFGSISFGNILPMGISEGVLAADLSAVGSLAGGGDLGEVDLVYVPEPTAAALIILGILARCLFRRHP